MDLFHYFVSGEWPTGLEVSSYWVTRSQWVGTISGSVPDGSGPHFLHPLQEANPLFNKKNSTPLRKNINSVIKSRANFFCKIGCTGHANKSFGTNSTWGKAYSKYCLCQLIYSQLIQYWYSIVIYSWLGYLFVDYETNGSVTGTTLSSQSTWVELRYFLLCLSLAQ